MIRIGAHKRAYEGARERRKRRHDIYGVLIFAACGAILALGIWLDFAGRAVCG